MAKSKLTRQIENAKRRLKTLEKEKCDDPDGKITCRHEPIADVAAEYIIIRDEDIRKEKNLISSLKKERKKRSEEKKDSTRQIRNIKRRLRRLKAYYSDLQKKGLIPAEPGSDAELIIASMESEIHQNEDLLDRLIEERSTL